MSLSGAEKLEVIKLVEGSELPVKRTLAELGVSRSSFYRWYRQYLDDGPEGLEPTVSRQKIWHKTSKKLRETFIYYKSCFIGSRIVLNFPSSSVVAFPV